MGLASDPGLASLTLRARNVSDRCTQPRSGQSGSFSTGSKSAGTGPSSFFFAAALACAGGLSQVKWSARQSSRNRRMLDAAIRQPFADAPREVQQLVALGGPGADLAARRLEQVDVPGLGLDLACMVGHVAHDRRRAHHFLQLVGLEEVLLPAVDLDRHCPGVALRLRVLRHARVPVYRPQVVRRANITDVRIRAA